MNSPRAGQFWFEGTGRVSYTWDVMTQYRKSIDRVPRCQQAMCLLGELRVVMAEVRACDISKLSVPGVVPT